MQNLIYYAAAIWVVLLTAVVMVVLVRNRQIEMRILAFDTLGFLLVGLLALISLSVETSYYLDAALVLALLSFIGTLAAARYHGERRLF